MKAEAKFQHVENTCLKSIALYSMSVHREIRITKRIKCPSQYIYIYIYIVYVYACICIYIILINYKNELNKLNATNSDKNNYKDDCILVFHLMGLRPPRFFLCVYSVSNKGLLSSLTVHGELSQQMQWPSAPAFTDSVSQSQQMTTCNL